MSNAAALTADLDALVADAAERLADARDLDALAALDAEFLGKRSAVTAAKKQLGDLGQDDRKAAGQAINAARTSLESAIAEARERLAAGARAVQYEAERL
ncbi:MAG TPA: phenylalanine--tRNA ligase subunit alpha, partial [Acidimicrobiaceae bacterium]|nr:phenylalanine--tRNA ligase subunit alpha [Acidimicrobiaceae bacterium]